MNEVQPIERPVKLLSVVIPACNEEGCICSTVEHLDATVKIGPKIAV